MPRYGECPICLEEIKELGLMPCGHRFCIFCMHMELIAQHRNRGVERHCPSCRQPVEAHNGGRARRGADGHEYWPFLGIIGHMGRGRHIRYLIVWLDGSLSFEPERNLSVEPGETVAQALARYRRCIRNENQARYERHMRRNRRNRS